jgi:hypothetical protein
MEVFYNRERIHSSLGYAMQPPQSRYSIMFRHIFNLSSLVFLAIIGGCQLHEQSVVQVIPGTAAKPGDFKSVAKI